MVEDIDPHIIGITESWANINITDAELGLTGYVMFRPASIMHTFPFPASFDVTSLMTWKCYDTGIVH